LKKLFKWSAIVAGSLLLIFVISIISVFIAHDRYGFFPSGGQISELQKQYDVIFYDINLEVLSEKQALDGFTNVMIKSLTNGLSIIELDLIDNFDVSRVLAREQELAFRHDDQKLVINLVQSLNLDQILELSIHYSGQPIQAIVPPWIGGFNWSKDQNDDDWIGVSCQGEGGKIWFPCKTHPSDEPDSVAINITAPKPYYCAANGVLQEISEPGQEFQTFHWLTRYPINNYNISINIAKYKILEKSYTSVENNTIPVIYYYLTASSGQADSLVNMAIDMLKSFEKFFGEYPFAREKFGLAETAYPGMEHQTINSYGNNYRMTEINGFEFDQLMLHEMAHEWWGNKVTVDDWADFWIHEGIGTYSEALYILDKLGEGAYHDYMARKKKRIRNRSPILIERQASSYEAYSGDIYYKGAYFMHSLRYALDDSLFFAILFQFANDSVYTYQNQVITEDFLDLVNEKSGQDYVPFFNFFLKTTNLPNIVVDSLGNGQWTLSVPNIDFELPMEFEIEGELRRIIVGPEKVLIDADSAIVVDPRKWYLHRSDFSD
jgi:aminopeptidase N